MSNKFSARAGRLALLACASAMTACTVHAPLKPVPEISAAALDFERSAAGVKQTQWPDTQWWTQLGDAQLSELVQEGLRASPDMDVALARIQKARAQAAAAGAQLTPSVDAKVGVQRSQLSANGIFPPPLGGSTLWQNKASVDIAWELDFWGRQRSTLRAALREEEATQLESSLAALSLSTSIARRYIEWQRIENQLDIARSRLADRESLFKLTNKRVEAGIESKLGLQSAEAGVPQARADVTSLEAQVAVARIELAALVGAGPDRGLALQRPAIAAPAPSGTPTLVPAELIARRTDVMARRLRAEAAAARADAAKADFYPNINLAASVGLDSTTFSDWVDSGSRFYNAGPALSLPLFGTLFNTGTRRATLKIRTAEYDEAVAAYRQALLGAVRDVAATLAEMQAIDREQQDVDAAAAGQQRAYDLTVRRYDAGIGSHIEVLVAEEQWLNECRRVVDLGARRLDASVRLVSALGGGLPVPVSAPLAQQ